MNRSAGASAGATATAPRDPASTREILEGLNPE